MRTLASPASIEVIIKHSRFIANAARVDKQAETLAFYESVADPAATHNCWAWRMDHQYRCISIRLRRSIRGSPVVQRVGTCTTRYWLCNPRYGGEARVWWWSGARQSAIVPRC